MEFIKDEIYKYQQIADEVTSDIIDRNCHIIGITGTSSVGKSTFTKMIKAGLVVAGHKVQVLGTDDYLKKEFRAHKNLWNRLDGTYLRPDHFDWERLKREITTLDTGKCIRRECYVRGIGWGTKCMLEPAEYIIIEGLFMDSKEAVSTIEYDLLILLTADDELVRTLRTRRDAFYRQNYKDFHRSESETQKEIENTLHAGKAYEKCYDVKRCLQLHALGNYNATVDIIKE